MAVSVSASASPSASTSSPPLTITFCYDAQAHLGCIQQTEPHYITGIKPSHRVEKILKKFRKKSKLADPEAEVENLELHRCFCKEKDAGDTACLLDSRRRISKTDLEEGDRVFVRRIDRVDVDQDSVVGNQDAFQANTGNDLTLSSLKSKTKGEWSNPNYYRDKTIRLLGGDAFLSKNNFEEPFITSVGKSFWINIFTASRISYRMTPRSDRKKDGLFPSILIDSVNHCIRRRRMSAPRYYARVIAKDLQSAAELMQSQAVFDAAAEDNLPSSDESDQELSTDLAPTTEAQIRSFIDRISGFWKSDSWKRQRLRSDLGPISICFLDVLAPLAEMARLTASQEPIGLPPLVRKALNQALADEEALSKQGKIGRITSPSGWAQRKVVRKALPILRSYLQSQAASIPASLAPPSQINSSSTSDDSRKQSLSEVKSAMKRKLSDATIDEEEKAKIKKRYKKLKRSLKKETRRESNRESR